MGASGPYDDLNMGQDNGDDPTQYMPPIIESGEHVIIGSRRNTPLVVEVKRTAEINANRDAIILMAHLETALDNDTWTQFVNLLVSKYAMTSDAVRQFLSSLSTRSETTRTRRPKKLRVPKPKTYTLDDPDTGDAS